ncbi:MAG: DUF4430 domain-containing protein [Clostridiales bacterium]|nr:DUF4430 domain-containing protein [Clostridiales bacterium]
MNFLKKHFSKLSSLRAIELAAAIVFIAGAAFLYRGYSVDEYTGEPQATETVSDMSSNPVNISEESASEGSTILKTDRSAEGSAESNGHSANSDASLKKLSEERVTSSADTNADASFLSDSGTTAASEASDIEQSEAAAILQGVPLETSDSVTESVEDTSVIIASGSSGIMYSSSSGPGSSSSSGGSSSSASDSITLPESAAAGYPVCTVTISCEPFLDDVSEAVRSRLPADGIILPVTEVEFRSGESVYDVLKRVCRAKGIPYRASSTYYGAYVSSIDNLSEKYYDYSTGWCYYVDDEYAMVSSDQWQLEGGEHIDWIYDSWSM